MSLLMSVVGNGGDLLDVPITSWASWMTVHLKVSQFTVSQSASVLKTLVMEQQEAEVGVMEPGGDKAWLVPSRVVSSEFEPDLCNQKLVVFGIRLCSCALDFFCLDCTMLS